MKMAALRLVLVLFLILTGAGCARYHHGRPDVYGEGYGAPSPERVGAEVKQLVEQNVKDPEKARQAQALVQEIFEEVKKSAQETRGFHEQLNALNADYHATPEQFMKVLDELNNSRMASASKILGIRFKMRSLLTAEEWKNLSDAMNKARNRYVSSPRAEGG
ncbi:MAG: hypothetical protein C4293_22040 [Nitrospiraceae bacterium]